MAPLAPTAVRWDTFWWEDQPEHARPVGIGQELLQFAKVYFCKGILSLRAWNTIRDHPLYNDNRKMQNRFQNT